MRISYCLKILFITITIKLQADISTLTYAMTQSGVHPPCMLGRHYKGWLSKNVSGQTNNHAPQTKPRGFKNISFIYSPAFKIPIINKEYWEYLQTQIQVKLEREPTMTLSMPKTNTRHHIFGQNRILVLINPFRNLNTHL